MHECPEIRDWRLFLEGAMPAEERSGAESHLVRCPLCRARLIELYDEEQETRFIESAPLALQSRIAQSTTHASNFPRARATFTPYVSLGLAASILIAVGVSIYVFRISQPLTGVSPKSDVRESRSAAGAFELTNPPNGAEVSAGKLEFRWADAGPGARYELTFTDEKGDILYQENRAPNTVVLDTSTLKLASRKAYYWSIRAKLPDGTYRESSVSRFTLR